MPTRRVYLVPGFFGFVNLGDLAYWGHVARFFERRYGSAVHVVPVPPAGSLRARASTVAAHIASTSDAADPLYLVGHSAGGLDCRLLLTPGARVSDLDLDPMLARVRALVTVSTPHRGTPAAGAFSSIQGRRLLRVLSLATALVLRHGSLPLRLLLPLGELLVAADPDQGVIDDIYNQLLGQFTEDRRAQVAAFVDSLSDDQSLLEQLRPEAMDVFDAATGDRPGVRYGCVVNRARPPGLGGAFRNGLSPYGQGAYAWYIATWQISSRMSAARLAPLSAAQLAAVGVLGELRPEDNDGMVPTLSQVHGTVVRAVQADHLDVIGHFSAPDETPPHVDWIKTGSGFDRERFEATWEDVADFLFEESAPAA